jgi:hypothetical protein
MCTILNPDHPDDGVETLETQSLVGDILYYTTYSCDMVRTVSSWLHVLKMTIKAQNVLYLEM